jgi:PAT family beta-lactamase induction signal transducer AmpG
MSTLKAMLTDQNFDIKTVGFLSLVAVPYSLKFLFAPIIDSFSIPFFTKKFGQRKSWIFLTQILLTIFIALLATVSASGNIFLIAITSLLVAVVSASQDIVIDGYRIELIDQQNQGFATSFYVYGYRIGMLISGAFALFLADNISWKATYFVMSCIMMTSLTATLFADETRKNFIPKNYNFFSWIKSFVVAPLLDFTARDKCYAIFAFIILFKLSDAFAGSITIPFLLSLDFTKTEIASIVKTFGLFATLFGVFVGGVLVKKIGVCKSLWISALAQAISNLAFSYLAKIGHNSELLYLVIFAENFSGGVGDCVFVAYLSGLCNIQFSATQYALLTSLATIARSLLSSASGVVVNIFGWYYFFIFSSLLAIPSLVFLYSIKLKTPNL